MISTRLKPVLWAALVCIAAPAVGSGGGGGGSLGTSPSESAPRYDAAAEYRAGVAALGENRFADAKRNFDHVLAVAPRDANSQYLGGLARMGLSDAKGAVRFFEKAIKYDANLIAAHKQYGLALIASGKRDKAQAALDALKARGAQCGDTCAQAADLRDAIAAITAALGAPPQASNDIAPGLLFMRPDLGDQAYLEAVGLINARRYDDAIVALVRAERAFGPHPDILTYLGFANRKLKRYDLAEDFYRQALLLAPGHRGATEYYGELMVERGDIAGAQAQLAQLDESCTFGCYEAEELRRWIDSGHGSGS